MSKETFDQQAGVDWYNQLIIDGNTADERLAAAVEAMRAKCEKLEAALKPFADAHFYYSDAGKPDDTRTGIGGVTYGDFRRAVSVLADIETARAALGDTPQ